jgi:hypothetical protein
LLCVSKRILNTSRGEVDHSLVFLEMDGRTLTSGGDSRCYLVHAGVFAGL